MESLFPKEPTEPALPGLRYVPDFLDQATHDGIVTNIDTADWMTSLKRRVQQYGWSYPYKRGQKPKHLGAFPGWAMSVARQLVKDNILPAIPDELIVNGYQPGQGIGLHVDHPQFFADHIVSVSLLSPCVMEFKHDTHGKVELVLDPRSALHLSGSARWEWKHGIRARKSDKIGGQTVARQRRISLTFRTMAEEVIKNRESQ